MRGRQTMRNQAQLIVLLFVTATVLVGPAMSKPLWSTLAGDNYLYPTAEVNAQPQYLAAYQSAHSPPYYVYNVHPSVGGAPTAVFAAGKPGVPPTFPAYSFYYGMPIYDIRIPLSAVYPVLTPSHPGLGPISPPTSTQQPFDVDIDDDRIEKLDSKVDASEATKPATSGGEQDADSITVEAI